MLSIMLIDNLKHGIFGSSRNEDRLLVGFAEHLYFYQDVSGSTQEGNQLLYRYWGRWKPSCQQYVNSQIITCAVGTETPPPF